MKTLVLTCLLIFFSFTALLKAQHCENRSAEAVLYGNLIEAGFTNGGDYFSNGAFVVPANGVNRTGTIFGAGLWLGGFDMGGNLKMAGQTFGGNDDTGLDYFPGPLDPDTGMADSASCANWNRIWIVRRIDVERHLADFNDNGLIDEPIDAIFGWPGKGNPHFFDLFGFDLPTSDPGLAPFWDENSDGNYNPNDGDFPLPANVDAGNIPEQILWFVFNDAGSVHTQTGGAPLGVEVQATAWAFNCSDNAVANQTIFTRHKVINRSNESLDSVYAGLWLDLDIGCSGDDYVGSDAASNTFFGYNDANIDQGCDPSPNYGMDPPVQAATFLNQTLSKFMYYDSGSDLEPEDNMPQTFYRFLSGSWSDGEPLRSGGDGYDPSGVSPLADLAFPDDPNNAGGWSMEAENIASGDRRAVGSTYIGTMGAGAIVDLDVAYSFHRGDGLDRLENVTLMYSNVDLIQNWYDAGFDFACPAGFLVEKNFCANDPVSPLNLATDAVEWNWSTPGADVETHTGESPTFSYPDAGTYVITQVTVDNLGDTSVHVSTVVIQKPPTPLTVLGSRNADGGDTIVYSVFTSPPYDYNWRVTGGTIIGQDDRTITVVWDADKNMGEVCQSFTDDNGCTGDERCINITLTPTGTRELVLATGLTIYPNPSPGEVFVEMQRPAQMIEVFDLLGRRVLSLDAPDLLTAIELPGEEAVYLFRVTFKEGAVSEKILIKQ